MTTKQWIGIEEAAKSIRYLLDVLTRGVKTGNYLLGNRPLSDAR